jgi:DNA-binding NarL/FixJ family response regulator
MTIRVGICDDQALVRDGLQVQLGLAGDIEVVGLAADGEQAIALARRELPDVLLMDIRMPILDGIEATRQIAKDPATQGVRVLVLTTFDLDEHVYDALRAGAAGFLLKDVTSERLVAAVEDTAAGESPLAPSVVRRVVDHFVGTRPQEVRDPRLGALSERELEVLGLVGAGLSNSEIADRLFISVATVKTHVRHTLAKLDLRDRVQAVVLARENGLPTAPGESAR